MINLIFETRGMTSVLAHVLLHSVIELTLPSIDANHFKCLFHQCSWLDSDWLEKNGFWFCSICGFGGCDRCQGSRSGMAFGIGAGASVRVLPLPVPLAQAAEPE